MGRSKIPKILFWDIETTLLQAWLFHLGDQTVRHTQLVEGRSRYGIICLSYCWNRGPIHTLDWGYHLQSSEFILSKFDKLLEEADIVIGKNSDRFDIKHLNAQRMFYDRPGRPSFSKYTDDLEKQLRKYFALPSYSLDYISKELGLGGKDKMEFNDWVNIMVKDAKQGEKSYNKMLRYNRKDVKDTRDIWYYCEKHFDTKFNYGKFINAQNDKDQIEKLLCKHCGHGNLVKNGIKYRNTTIYQRFYCRYHHGEAGYALITKSGYGEIR